MKAMHGTVPSCGRCAVTGTASAGRRRVTVPGPVTMAVIMRKEAGFWTVTVSPMPPSLMARPMAVSSTPGASKVMVTVWPLVTTIGRRTSSARTASPARSMRRACMPSTAANSGDDAGHQGACRGTVA